MATKSKLGDIVSIVWKDHEIISDIQIKMALYMETLCFVSYGKLVAENDDYYFVATSYNSYDHHNNDFIRILKNVIVDIKVLEKGDL